eukprot:IDg17245t1
MEVPMNESRKYEWCTLVLHRSKEVYNGADYDREITARASYVEAILQRSRRYGKIEETGDPGFGDSARPGSQSGSTVVEWKGNAIFVYWRY